MTTSREAFVCFRAGGVAYAVPVTVAGAVLARGAFEALPAPRPDVLGLQRTPQGPLPVLAPFGADGRHVVVLGDGAERFGLLVDEVTGIVRLEPDELGPAPAGQAHMVVRAVANGAGGGALVLDPAALDARVRGGSDVMST